jgi:hypothetical protein
MKSGKLLILLTAATVVVGCGSQTATIRAAAPPAPGTTVSAAGAENMPANPLDAWFKGPVGESLRRGNEEQQVAACMKRAAFQWVPRVFGPSEPATRVGLREYRKSKGYGIYATPAVGAVTAENDPNLAFMKTLTEDELLKYLDALEGPYGADGRRGGCRDQAAAPDPGVARRRGNARAVQLWSDMQSSPDVVAGMKSWSQCMATAGFAGLAGPEDARSLAGTSGSATTEVKIASADVQCAESYLWEAWRKYGDRAVGELGPP